MYIDYMVFQDPSLEHLEASVKSKFADQTGWQPIGGVAVVYVKLDEDVTLSDKGKPSVLYLQAMGRLKNY